MAMACAGVGGILLGLGLGGADKGLVVAMQRRYGRSSRRDFETCSTLDHRMLVGHH